MKYPSGIAVVVLALIPLLAHATAQEPDRLILNGQEYNINTNPLEVYLAQHPEKRPEPEISSTSNWRGYVATWEVIGQKLLLKDVTIEVAKPGAKVGSWDTESRSVMADLFPSQDTVIASWFTGHIIIPTGELVAYVHMGYGSTYDGYILLQVKDGFVTKNWQASKDEYEAFRRDQFTRFTQTEQYANAVAQLKESAEGSDDFLESFMYEFYVAEYTAMVFEE